MIPIRKRLQLNERLLEKITFAKMPILPILCFHVPLCPCILRFSGHNVWLKTGMTRFAAKTQAKYRVFRPWQILIPKTSLDPFAVKPYPAHRSWFVLSKESANVPFEVPRRHFVRATVVLLASAESIFALPLGTHRSADTATCALFDIAIAANTGRACPILRRPTRNLRRYGTAQIARTPRSARRPGHPRLG